MVDKHDPFAIHIPNDSSAEAEEAERQKLLRQHMEDELLRDAERFNERIRKSSQTD